jgi:hypothetical protein
MSAAANGEIRPKSTRLMDTAAEIVARDQPNSSWSGSIRTLGTARKPAAPMRVTNAAAATSHAQWIRGRTRRTRGST